MGITILSSMNIVRSVNAVLGFLLEIAMLISFGLWGFLGTGRSPLRWFAMIGAPLVVVVIWAFLAAPNSTTRLHQPALFFLQLGLMLLAAFLLLLIERPVPAAILAGLAIASQLTELVLG